MELSTIAAITSVSLAVATFFLGRMSSSNLAGKESGSLVTDIKYIKESIARIERRLDADIRKLEDRADETSMQIAGLIQELSRVRESARGVHRRLNDHLAREHCSQKE